MTELRLFRVDGSYPFGERFLPANSPANPCVTELTMRVNQTWQKNTLAKIDQRSGISRFDLVELFHVDYPIPRNCDCAIFNRRSIHRHDDSGVNDHSLFTTFRHA